MVEFTIEQLIAKASEALKTLSDSASLDARLLLSHVINQPLSYLYTWPEQSVLSNEKIHFDQLISRRLSGEPIAYILGFKEFWSLELACNASTLIPRPDTEIIIEQVLNLHELDNTNTENILDLGTGTGAIALALASEFPTSSIDAIDYSEDAVKLAQQNKQKLNITNVNIYQSDWFNKIKPERKFNVIVSNPPYIDENDSHLSQGDVRFEPMSALVALNEGYADIIHIIDKARSFLANSGYLLIEHGYKQAEKVRMIFQECGYHSINTIKDYGNNDRITYAIAHQLNKNNKEN